MFTINNGPLAQLAEQGTLNPKVEGSIPSRPTIFPHSFQRPAANDCRYDCVVLACARVRFLHGPPFPAHRHSSNANNEAGNSSC